jgi:hypothetical protein
MVLREKELCSSWFERQQSVENDNAIAISIPTQKTDIRKIHTHKPQSTITAATAENGS